MAKKNEKLSTAAKNRIKGYEAKSTLVDTRRGVRRNDNIKAFGIAVAALVVAISAQLIYFNFGPGIPKPTPKPVVPKVAPVSAAENRSWTGSMNLNSNTIDFTLDGQKAPQAVANFVTLVNKGFYNNLTCHRITTANIFVLQCGDPNGDGTGGPGYNFGPIENAPSNGVYSDGVIAMARQGGNANSQGSQFFIVYGSTFLPPDSAGGYTVFGKVTKNLNAVRNFALAGTVDGKTDGKPKNPIRLTNLSVK